MSEYNETIQLFVKHIFESNDIDTDQLSKLGQQFIKNNTDFDDVQNQCL